MLRSRTKTKQRLFLFLVLKLTMFRQCCTNLFQCYCYCFRRCFSCSTETKPTTNVSFRKVVVATSMAVTMNASWYQPLSMISALTPVSVSSLSRTSSFLGTTVDRFNAAELKSRKNNASNALGMQMKIKVGILGLPNVGKSTLFNSLVRKTIANAENYPFCTITPNTAPVIVPGFDSTNYISTVPILKSLQSLENRSDKGKSDRTVDATIQLIDVAGLVKDAHKGDGLGNQFLGTLRECTALLHLVRVFPDDINSASVDSGNNNIMHVNGKIDPVSDATDILLELLLADLEHVQRRLDRTTCKGIERSTLEIIESALQAGKSVRTMELSQEQVVSIKSMGLLTQKPMVYVFNVDEIDFLYDLSAVEEYIETDLIKEIVAASSSSAIPKYTIVSAKIEAAIATATDDDGDRQEKLLVLNELGIIDTSDGSTDLDHDRRLEEMEQQMSYNVIPSLLCKMLGYGIVYTGVNIPNERSKTIKAHLIRCGNDTSGKTGNTTVYDFAGRIHGKIQDGFLHAEVISVHDLLSTDSFQNAKDAGGLVRREGKDYCLQHNDVVVIKWKDG